NENRTPSLARAIPADRAAAELGNADARATGAGAELVARSTTAPAVVAVGSGVRGTGGSARRSGRAVQLTVTAVSSATQPNSHSRPGVPISGYYPDLPVRL